MNKNKTLIIIGIIVVVIVVLWIGWIIPKQSGKIYGIIYMKNNFQKMQLEYINIEWSQNHDDYIITFKDKDNQQYGCTIGPKYFPINLGQGLNVKEMHYFQQIVHFASVLDNSKTMYIIISY